MSTLLLEVVRLFRRRGVPHAIVGAAALAVHGVSRSTLDLDLLTTDRTVLRQTFWSEAASPDPDDPARRVTEQLAGLPGRCRSLWQQVRAE